MLDRVARRDGRTDHDVADELGDLRRRRLAGTAAAGVGNPPGGFGFVVDGETEDVGRTLFAHELLVERGDRRLVQEDQRDLGQTAHALVGQGAVGERDPAPRGRSLVVLLVGSVDVDAHDVCWS